MSEQQVFTKDQLNEMDVDALLDADISMIALMEGYTPVPSGEYRIEILSCLEEELGAENKRAFILETNLLEAIALENEEERSLLPEGSLPRAYKETFFLDSKDKTGIKKFRTVFDVYAQTAGLNTTRAIQEALNAGGITGSVLIKHKTWKDKQTGAPREGNEFDLSGFIAE